MIELDRLGRRLKVAAALAGATALASAGRAVRSRNGGRSRGGRSPAGLPRALQSRASSRRPRPSRAGGRRR